MNRQDTYESIPIINRLCTNLASIIVDKGAAGANARMAIGDVVAFAKTLCVSNEIGPALNNCFDMVRQTNCTVQQMMTVRNALAAELAPKTVGATHVKNYSIFLALGHAAKIIATMVFISREDVEIVLQRAQQPFSDAIETAADEMDQKMFQNLIALQSALTNHLVVSARPLPQMLGYQFADVLPSLVIAHRLYADASRADDIRMENKIVHPAFCPVAGRALSA
jgi:prophage DNA circulation protein